MSPFLESYTRNCAIIGDKSPPSILNSGNLPDIPTFPCMQNYVLSVHPCSGNVHDISNFMSSGNAHENSPILP